MTKMKFDNRARLLRVKEKEWREALDELTAYITWRLHGRTEFGAHSEAVLGDSALAHYSHEAYTKLICGEWKWDENLSLAFKTNINFIIRYRDDMRLDADMFDSVQDYLEIN